MTSTDEMRDEVIVYETVHRTIRKIAHNESFTAQTMSVEVLEYVNRVCQVGNLGILHGEWTRDA